MDRCFISPEPERRSEADLFLGLVRCSYSRSSTPAAPAPAAGGFGGGLFGKPAESVVVPEFLRLACVAPDTLPRPDLLSVPLGPPLQPPRPLLHLLPRSEEACLGSPLSELHNTRHLRV